MKRYFSELFEDIFKIPQIPNHLFLLRSTFVIEEFDRYSKQCLAVEDSCSKFGKFVWEFESFGAWCDSRENLVDLFQQIQRIIWKTITKYYDEKSTTKHVLNAIQPKWLKIFISAEIESKGKSNYQTRNDVYSLVMQHACALTLSEGSGSSSSGGFSSRDMDEGQRPSRNFDVMA